MTRIVQVDAFTCTRFTGNPAGVCVLQSQPRRDWMQAVAREMNVSETAFLWPDNDGYRLRWFTPTVEVDLCGHATLASAHVLWEYEYAPHDQPVTFHTRSGDLSAQRSGDWITLDFPSEPAISETDGTLFRTAVRGGVLSAWRNRFDMLVEMQSEDQVRLLKPDMRSLAGLDCRGVIVTSRCQGESEYDFVSRFFAPAVGIDEDPVTGSAHCFLGPFWAERLGKNTVLGYQASERGGVVRVEMRGDRVGIAGQAVTVLEGRLLG